MSLLDDVDQSLMGPATRVHDSRGPRPLIEKIANLKDLNLESELLTHLNTAKQLLSDAVYDESSSLAQQASALNSITAIITQLTKTSIELYNAERQKILESTLIATLKKFPELQVEFITEYQEALNGLQ